MIKLNTFIPSVDSLRRASRNVQNLKDVKYIKIGKSGLPVEMPINSFKDVKVAEMLKDSFSYDRAKDSITIATNYSKK